MPMETNRTPLRDSKNRRGSGPVHEFKQRCRPEKYAAPAATLWMTRRRSPTASDDADDNGVNGANGSNCEEDDDFSEGPYQAPTPRSSDTSESSGLENSSAIAKGADAMVKNMLSRPTEIIDMSKMIEEGKVETEYEEPELVEFQDRAMIDEYEKGFAYARRLRALLNMQFKDLDRATVDTNFLLVKAHEHPTQRMIDRWRKVDYGISYNDQVKRQKQIDDFRANAVKKKSKDEGAEQIYPEMIRFTVRFRKDNSEKRWTNYLAFRQKQKKKLGRAFRGAVPKPNDKYTFAFLDVWSFCVVAYVKPSATVREIVDPVFSRLGLGGRADFAFTIGCFCNDKRSGKAKILGVPNLPEPLQIHQLACDLYKTNCTEIYVNDNRCEMFRIFPDYYYRGMPKKPNEEPTEPQKKKKKAKKQQVPKDDKKGGELATEAKDNKEAAGSTEQGAKSPAANTNRSNASAVAGEADSFTTDSTLRSPGGRV